jgi:hypothetical protein
VACESCLSMVATWCANASIAAAKAQARWAFMAAHRRAIGLRSGLSGGPNRPPPWVGISRAVAFWPRP